MRKRNRKKTSRLPDVLIAAGIILLLAPLFLSARMSLLQSREAAEIKPPPPVPKAARAAAELPVAAPDKPQIISQTEKPSIVIPKLNLDATIVEEVSEADLDRGPMRLARTGIPGVGNCCIAAHREKWFRGLQKLVVGDTVILKSDGKDYIYFITDRRIVPAEKVSILGDTSVPTVTLITCSDSSFLGRGNGRLIVRGELKTVN